MEDRAFDFTLACGTINGFVLMGLAERERPLLDSADAVVMDTELGDTDRKFVARNLMLGDNPGLTAAHTGVKDLTLTQVGADSLPRADVTG